MTGVTPQQRLEAFVATLHPTLVAHIQRVRQEAATLAHAVGLDPNRADLASLAHDVARLTPMEELRREARVYNLTLDPVDEALPVLLHGPVGAEWLYHRFHLEDEEIREAVRWHSTAQRGLSPLGKVVFLADKLDPDKKKRYPYQDDIRRLALKDLDAGVLSFLDHELQTFLEGHGLIHPASLHARNELLVQQRHARRQ